MLCFFHGTIWVTFLSEQSLIIGVQLMNWIPKQIGHLYKLRNFPYPSIHNTFHLLIEFYLYILNRNLHENEDSCHYNNLDYNYIAKEFGNNYPAALKYALQEQATRDKDEEKQVLCSKWHYDDSIYTSTIVTQVKSKH